jgi:hypothetical protein
MVGVDVTLYAIRPILVVLMPEVPRSSDCYRPRGTGLSLLMLYNLLSVVGAVMGWNPW